MFIGLEAPPWKSAASFQGCCAKTDSAARPEPVAVLSLDFNFSLLNVNRHAHGRQPECLSLDSNGLCATEILFVFSYRTNSSLKAFARASTKDSWISIPNLSEPSMDFCSTMEPMRLSYSSNKNEEKQVPMTASKQKANALKVWRCDRNRRRDTSGRKETCHRNYAAGPRTPCLTRSIAKGISPDQHTSPSSQDTGDKRSPHNNYCSCAVQYGNQIPK